MLKVGRTNDLGRRLGEYPRGCAYLRTFGPIVDCRGCERRLIEAFKAKFVRYRTKGLEYFCGDAAEMVAAFASFCVDDPCPMLA